MSKIKRPEREHPFTVIDDRLFKDQRISAKAKAVHAYIYGKPDGWQTSVQHVINTFKEGKTAVYNAVDELVEHGYWKRQQTRKDDGTLGKVNYVIQEVPDGKSASQANEATSGFSGCGSSGSGSSASGSSGSGKQDPKKKDNKNKEGKKKESSMSSSLRSEGQSPPSSGGGSGESDEDEPELSDTGESTSTRNGQSNDRSEKNFRAAGMMAAMNALEECDGAGEENFVMSLVFRDPDGHVEPGQPAGRRRQRAHWPHRQTPSPTRRRVHRRGEARRAGRRRSDGGRPVRPLETRRLSLGRL
jgi:hypothetical protein